MKGKLEVPVGHSKAKAISKTKRALYGPRVRNVMLALTLVAFGCAAAPEPAPKASNPPPLATAHTRIMVDDPSVFGASGLTRTRDGRFLAALERAHRVVELRIDAKPPQLGNTWNVVGVPTELDLEAVVEIDEGTVLFGTESKQAGRSHDALYFGRYDKDRIVVEEEPLLVDYGAWGIKPTKNRGIEGICFAGGRIIAAAEDVPTADGRRYAPVATYDLLQRKWTYHRLYLSSPTGKISGLTCRSTANGILVFGIERHYEVARVVRFELPKSGGEQNVELEVVLDLATLFESKIPNFEGITLGDDAELVLLTDNDYGGVSGPTQVIRLREPFVGMTGGANLAPRPL